MTTHRMMVRTLRSRIGRAAMVAVILAAVTPAARAQDLGIQVGAKAPSVKIETLEGVPADLGKFIGKQPILIEFWATWCPNCKELEPKLKAAFEKHGSAVQFVLVAVSLNESPALAKAFVEKYKLPGTQLYDTHGHACDSDGYDCPATSYVVIVDKAGKVVYTGLGGGQDLEAALKKVM